jgi:hypothetical protein
MEDETQTLTVIGMALVVVGIAVDSTFDAELLEPTNIAGLLIMLFGVLVQAYVVVRQGEDTEDNKKQDN